MVNSILGVLISFTSIIHSAYAFEGIIKFAQESQYETSYYSYFVKNEKIRIDKFDVEQKLIQSLLIDIENDEVFVLSPSKKMYTRLERPQKSDIENENFIIQKTQNSRKINNYECFQWRVKNIERNTEVTFWVCQNDFKFFGEIVGLLNLTDKSFEFFEKIPDKSGVIPMLSVERTLLRREKSRIYVVDIISKPLNNSLFIIPADYQMISS